MNSVIGCPRVGQKEQTNMTKRYAAFGALLVLAVIFLAVGPAQALTHFAMPVLIGLGLALGLAGTATITYLDPATAASTTAPSTTQASHSGYGITAQMVMADADTTATITHNMSLSTTQLNLLRPFLTVVGLSIGTAYPALSWALNTNTVVCTKGNTSTGSGGTYEVEIQRPGPLVTSTP
jgi:hypothetical protein